MIEVLKQALERAERKLSAYVGVCTGDKELTDAVLPMVRQAIAELESQEPLAWQVEVYIDGGWSTMGNPQRNKSRAEALVSNPSIPKEKQRIVELYTHPPQRTWQGLADDEIASVGYNNHPLDGIRSYARAIEAKLKEKNT